MTRSNDHRPHDDDDHRPHDDDDHSLHDDDDHSLHDDHCLHYDDDHSLHDDDDHRPHDDDDLHRLHSGTMCFPGKIGTSMGIKENNIFGLISQTFQFMAKYIFSAIHLKNNPFCLKILGQSELSEDRGIRFKIWFQDHIFIHNCEFVKL